MVRKLLVTSAPLLLALALTALVGPSGADAAYERYLARAGSCAHADDLEAPPALARQAMACLVNYARRARGLEPLAPSRLLDRAAALKLAADIRCGTFSHTPCGDPFTEVFRQAGYTSPNGGWTLGENLAWGTQTLSSPRTILDAWLNSREHRRILFTPGFRELGVGLARPRNFLGQTEVALWATSFGARAGADRVGANG